MAVACGAAGGGLVDSLPFCCLYIVGCGILAPHLTLSLHLPALLLRSVLPVGPLRLLPLPAPRLPALAGSCRWRVSLARSRACWHKSCAAHQPAAAAAQVHPRCRRRCSRTRCRAPERRPACCRFASNSHGFPFGYFLHVAVASLPWHTLYLLAVCHVPAFSSVNLVFDRATDTAVPPASLLPRHCAAQAGRRR